MMKTVTNYETLRTLLREQLKPGVITNTTLTKAALQEEIQSRTLFIHAWTDGLLLMRQRDGFQRMNFYLQPGASLPSWSPEQPIVLEIPYRPRDVALAKVGAAWEQLGFLCLFTRQRMTRLPGDPPGIASDPIRLASPKDLASCQALLQSCFDSKTGCLPTNAALLADLEQGRVLLTKDGQGILHQTPIPGGTELRHLAVAPQLRRQGAAQNLLTTYLQQLGQHISRTWVRQDNAPALPLYLKNGYTADGWLSKVYLLDGKERNYKYECETGATANFTGNLSRD